MKPIPDGSTTRNPGSHSGKPVPGQGFWREQWRQLKLAHCAIPNYGNARQFWASKNRVNAVYMKGRDAEDKSIERRLKVLKIKSGSRVLDIGAGPGTYAIPLALEGCPVTVVEPSPVMRDVLLKRIGKEKIRNITVIPKRWEDVSLRELGEPYDAVIASYSLTMMDIGEAIGKMQACCGNGGTIHLFWFLTSPAWVQVNADLWPHLHGGIFPGEPTADWLWQVLNEMGIYANLEIERQFPPSRYVSIDDAVEEFRLRLNCTTQKHEEIVRNYFQAVLRQDTQGYALGGGTLGAHIWWSRDDEDEQKFS